MKVVVLAPEYEKYRHFVETVDEIFHSTGTTIYHERNEIKVFELDDHTTLNVKRFTEPNLLNRFVYASLRKPKAIRAYENALHLTSLGVDTPSPIGYVVYKTRCSIQHSYLVTLHSPLSRTMYEFGDSDLDGREPIVKAFARFAAELHQKGVYHKDFSPGNILFDQTEGGDYLFTLVDINRIAYRESISLEDRCRNFCRLWGREPFFMLLSEEYAAATGFETDKVKELVIKYHKKFWKNRYNHFG